MGRSCVVCKSSYKNATNNSLFKVPADTEILKLWQAAIPGEIVLKACHFVCKTHFESKYVLTKYEKRDANGKIIAAVPFKHPRLDTSAIPTIFDTNPSNESLAAASIGEYTTVFLPCVKEEQSDELPDLTVHIKTESDESEIITEDIFPVEQPQFTSPTKPVCTETKISLDSQPKSLGTLAPAQTTAPKSELPAGFYLSDVIVNEGNPNQVGDEGNRKICSTGIPKSWSVSELSGQSLLFSSARVLLRNGVKSPVIEKCVILHADKTLSYHVYGRLANPATGKLAEILDRTETLPNILMRFGNLNVCNGIGIVNVYHLQANSVFKDGFERWHQNDCSLISKPKRCENCSRMRKVQLQKEARFKKNETLNRVFSSNPVEKKKLDAIRRRNKAAIRKHNRAKQHCSCSL